MVKIYLSFWLAYKLAVQKMFLHEAYLFISQVLISRFPTVDEVVEEATEAERQILSGPLHSQRLQKKPQPLPL